MIEIHINKDVGSYEAKLIGPFTARQTVCIAVAAPFCYLIYKIATPIIGIDAAGFLICIPAVIAWSFGWLKPYGMHTEKFVASVFVNTVLAPANRKYKTENLHENELIKIQKEMDQLDAEAGIKKSKIRQKKPRYKVSPDAVK